MRFLFAENSTFGHRGKIIVALSVIWGAIGFTILQAPESLTLKDPLYLVGLLPAWIRAWVWVGAAAVAIGFSRNKHTSALDKYAFVALIVPVAIRFFSFLYSGTIHLVLEREFDAYRFMLAFIWGMIMLVVLLLSRWPEPGKETTK